MNRFVYNLIETSDKKIIGPVSAGMLGVVRHVQAGASLVLSL